MVVSVMKQLEEQKSVNLVSGWFKEVSQSYDSILVQRLNSRTSTETTFSAINSLIN